MNCTEARDAILVAELAELQGGDATTPLATHLTECSACRARAASIVSQTGHIEAIVARRSATHRVRPSHRLAVIASLPVAAALIVAIAIRVRHEAVVVPSPPVASRPVAHNVSVDVARGQHTTVLKTADSTVTVIWLTPGEGQ